MLIPFGVFSAGVSNGGGGAASYDLISTTLISSETASVTFNVSSLAASGYKHLQIRLASRCSRADTSIDNISMQFNGDTGNNYSYHGLEGNGSSVSSFAAYSFNRSIAGQQTCSPVTANSYGVSVCDILDPFSSTKNKTIRAFGGISASLVRMSTTAWYNTSAITSIVLYTDGYSFVSGSRFSLYGIKG